MPKRQRTFDASPRGQAKRRRQAIARRTALRSRRPTFGLGFLGPEMKFADFESIGDAFAAAWTPMEDGTTLSVSSISQGDGESQRDGRKYLIHSIHMRARVNTAATESQTTPLSDLVGRFCLVQDMQTNSAQLTATEVMNGTLSNDELAFRNLQHTSRFNILWDKKWKIGRQQTNEGAINLFASGIMTTPIMSFSKTFDTPIPVICNGTGSTIAAITDNSFHVIGVGNNTTALLDYQVRIRFTG